LKIYIYGNQSFKKEIHETLEHANIKFKLDNNTAIEEINNINKLKETIKNNPKDIYLIDDDKIIKNNSLNKKLKFLAPKDGIEEEYLIQSGIADLSIDSLKELPKYIIKRYEELKLLEPKEKQPEKEVEVIEENIIELDDELAMLLSKGDNKKKDKTEDLMPVQDLEDVFSLDKEMNLDEIDDLIGNVDIKDNKTSDDIDDIVNFNDNFGLNNISFDYDDNDVLYKEESTDEIVETPKKSTRNILEDLDFLGEEVEEEEEDFSDLDKINNDLFGGFDFLNEEIQEVAKKEETNIFDNSKNDIEEKLFEDFQFLNENIDKVQEKDESLQGDKMGDEFFELDSLNEKDLLEALNYKVDENSFKSEYKPAVSGTKSETINIDSSNPNDLSLLISKLLSNKTLEITIKIKD
jgi:hypothetical protein